MEWKRVLILVLIFAGSVALRVPNLNRPLSKHHEFVTAISLRVLQVWEQEGAINLGLNPAMNYSGRANKGIDNHATSLHKLCDEQGNFYYTSHPPLAYILPYATFQLVGASASVLNLQIFHLFFHFLSGVLLLLIIKNLDGTQRAQLIGFTVYCFLPSTLWFQSNTYMSDMLVHFFFLWGILSLIRIKKAPSTRRLFVLLGVVFLMSYTSWLSVFFAFSGGIYALLFLKAIRWKVIAALFLGTMAGLVLMVIQYSTIAGFDIFWEQLTQRFGVRGSNSSESTAGFFDQKLKEMGLLLFNYVANYGSLAILVLSLLLHRLGGRKVVYFGQMKEFALISLLPILLLHLVLLNYSGHDFTALYASGFIAVSAAFVLSEFASRAQSLHLGTIVVLGSAVYLWVNRPGEISQNGDRYNEFALQGEFIRTTVSDDDVVFWMGKELDPMTIVYAKRNLVEITTIKEAHDYLVDHQFQTGVIIEATPGLLESKKIDRQN